MRRLLGLMTPADVDFFFQSQGKKYRDTGNKSWLTCIKTERDVIPLLDLDHQQESRKDQHPVD